MKENKRKLNYNLNLYQYYYIPIMLSYFLGMFFAGEVRTGVLGAVLMLVVLVESILNKKYRSPNISDAFALAYFLYNVVSIVWFLGWTRMPLKVYLDEASVSLLPMVFYLAGRCVTEKTKERYYKYTLYSFLFCFIAGIILYIWAPDFYVSWVYKMGYVSKPDVSTMRVRMLSFISSIPEGFIAVAGMLLSSYFLIHYKGKKGKAAFLVCLLAAFMTSQRSAMVVAFLVFLYANYLVFFRFKLLDKKYLMIESTLFLAAILLLAVVNFEAILKIWYRIESLPLAVGERSESWVKAMNADNMTSIWIGNGLGANGHKAIGYTDFLVSDGGLVKLFCEMGILGTSLFAYLMVRTLKNGYQNLELCYVELGIMAVALIQCIGNNIITYQIAAPVFWYAVGRCSRTLPVSAKGQEQQEVKRRMA